MSWKNNMRLYFHYCLFGFTNCFVLGTEGSDGREALVIDPGCMDEKIVNFIEKNEYTIRGILVTHDHINHVHGLKTLRKIYDAPVYAVNHDICEHRAIIVHDEEDLQIGPFGVRVLSVPGHSSDSAVYQIGHLLFTGDALSAGLVGRTASSYGTTIQAMAIRKKLFSLPGNYTVLPGHGPPSSLDAERRFNFALEESEKVRNQRVPFAQDIW